MNVVFQEPQYLWLLWTIPLYIYFQLKTNKKKREAIDIILNEELVKKYFSHIFHNKKNIFLISITLFFLILSLARPQWGKTTLITSKKGITIAFAIDLSTSMYATDIKPSRLKSVQLNITEFLDKLTGDEVGIVGFANSAAVFSPLTTDYKTLKEYVFSLSPKTIRNQGTDLGNALKTTLKLFDHASTDTKIVILISDGEDHGSTALQHAEILKKKNIKVYTIGIGSLEGSQIELYSDNGDFEGYLKDKNGNIVISKPNFKTLQEIAKKTNGDYILSSTGDLHLKKLIDHVNDFEKQKISQKKMSKKEDRYYIFLIFAFIAFILQFFPNFLRKNTN